FAVVEDHQQLRIAQGVLQRLDWQTAALFWRAKRRDGGARYRGNVDDRGELDQAHSLCVFGLGGLGDFQSQGCLPGAARARQRQQPSGLQQTFDLRYLVLATHEAAERDGEATLSVRLAHRCTRAPLSGADELVARLARQLERDRQPSCGGRKWAARATF